MKLAPLMRFTSLRLFLFIMALAIGAFTGCKPDTSPRTVVLPNAVMVGNRTGARLCVDAPRNVRVRFNRQGKENRFLTPSGRGSLQVTVMPANSDPRLPRTKAQLEEFVRTVIARQWEEQSVEGKTTVIDLAMGKGLCVGASYTDKSLVGKPIPATEEDYKVVTSAVARIDDFFVVSTVMGDSFEADDYKLMMSVLRTLRRPQ